MTPRPKRPVNIIDKNGAFHVAYLDRVKGGRYLAASFDKSSSTVKDVEKWVTDNNLILIKERKQKKQLNKHVSQDAYESMEEFDGKIYKCVWKKGTKTCTKAKYLSRGLFTNI